MKRVVLALAFCIALVGSAFAQGGMGPGPGTVHSTGGGSVSFTYTGGQADTSSSGLSTVNFTSLTVSAGYNVVAFAPAVGGPVTSMSICGTGATFLGSAQGDSWAVEMWGASVSGGTCTVTVNLTGTSFGSVMAYGVLSGANTTPAATARLNSPTTMSASQGTTTGLTLGASDIGLIAYSSQQTTYPDATWVAATNVGHVTNSRPAVLDMATTTTTGTPTTNNQLNNVGSILALKFTP